jgi:hypothetical protein
VVTNHPAFFCLNGGNKRGYQKIPLIRKSWLNMLKFESGEAEVAKKATVKKQNQNKLPKVVKPEAEAPKTAELPLWIKTVLGLAGLIALLAGYVAVQPDEYAVERELTIAAPVSKIFEQVNDFHRWAAWSPWEKMDPDMKETFDGPALGQGSLYHWVGNDKAGAGGMIITESEKNIHITVKLDYSKPVELGIQSIFYFTPKGKETLVKWRMTGKNDFMDKISQILNADKMDKMFGNVLQTGLQGLKAATE